ncbi:alpha/beta hydrolase [Psychromicrobium lacuslunae]|uniref:alpha/beta hydrolase n=1 Tax=Psychromicrobium lacuslunae TaxID=1618207 RepID=UPI00069686C5|nr:alpha/beta hydrolase [Psychromicrobium lacuslunae]
MEEQASDALVLPEGAEPAAIEWAQRISEINRELDARLAAGEEQTPRTRARELSDRLAMEFTNPINPDCEIRELSIPVRSGFLTVFHYRPKLSSELVRPVQLFFHGGGFVQGTPREQINHRLLSERSVASGCDILATSYALAPEQPFPAALNDAVDALNWLAEHAAEQGWDHRRIGIGGNSAGANIAALLALHARDHAGPVISHQLLEVIPASLKLEHTESFRLYATASDLAQWKTLLEAYLGSMNDPETLKAASPLLYPTLERLPATLVMVAEFDAVRDSGIEYATRLLESGVDARLWCGTAQLHASSGLTAVSAAARRWHQVAAKELKEHLVARASQKKQAVQQGV